jgi:NAD(P)H dehydrogenase (quinone)
MKQRILITLATGTTGFAITRQLLQEGYNVRILVRSLNARASALQGLGAEVVLGGFHQEAKFEEALIGVDSAYFCYPMVKGMHESMKMFIRAATKTNLRALVFMGQWLAEYSDAPSLLTRDVQRCYTLLEASGLNVVYYNPGFFADNVISMTESVAQLGVMPSPFGSGKCPWISTGDLGRCAAALLKNPDPYFGKKVHPTGPKAIGAEEMAAVYSIVAGRKVRVMKVSDKMFMKAVMAAAKEFGYDEFVAVQTTLYMQEFRRDRFGEPNTVVRELTGREPEDFETITRQFFATSPYSKRTFTGQLSAVGSMMRMITAKAPSEKQFAELNS